LIEQLWAKIDAFGARVAERYPGALACGPGCSDCCKRELTVTAIEADRIARLVAELSPEARAALAERASGAPACVALDPDGRCAIYAARPVVCRSHGVPLRFTEDAPDGRRALPVLDVCPRNFVGQDLAGVDPGCVLDQQTLSVLLGTMDALHAKQHDLPAGERLSLRDVILAAAS
jgi:hypothetical protein